MLDEDLRAAGNALEALVIAGGTLKLESKRAWVSERITGQPEWFGGGFFHETYVVTVKFGNEAEAPALYLYLMDDGSASSPESRFFDYEWDQTDDLNPIRQPRETWFLAGRGRKTMSQRTLDLQRINFGPFTDIGYGAIDEWLQNVKAGKDHSGLDYLVGRMSQDGVSIYTYVGAQHLCEFARFKLLEAHTNEVAKSAAAKVVIPQGLIESCSLAWLNMVTIELALVESGQSRIVPLLKCMYRSPPIVRGDASLLAAVFGDEQIQQAFWGSELASLLDFWKGENSRHLHLLALTKNQFDDLVKAEAIDPAAHQRYGGSHQACVCSETLRLHIPYFPADDLTPVQSGGPYTCLPLTHSAIAASNGFSLLTKQLTGWK